MKKTFKQFGLAVVIAAIALNAMLITGCNDDSDDSGNPHTNPHVNGDGSEGNGKDGKYNAIDLTASRWGSEEWGGYDWSSGDIIKLAHFTDVKPEEGDILRFKVSGVSDKELKYMKFELAQITGGNWDTYKFLGATYNHTLPNPFNDYTFEIEVRYAPDPDPNAVFILNINNHETIPADVPDGTVMATISNFEISFVEYVEYVEDEPEEQTLITITDIPAAYNGMYAIVALFGTMNDPVITAFNPPKRIANGKVENCAMQDESGEIFGKDGAYYVALIITEEPDLNGDSIYTGISSRKSVLKGSNTFSAHDFYPDITYVDAPAEPDTGE